MSWITDLKLIGVAVMLAAAVLFAIGLRGKVDDAELEKEKLACTAAKDAITTAAQTAANDATAHSRAVEEAHQRVTDAAIADHERAELAAAATIVAQRATADKLSSALAAVGAGSSSVPVPGCTAAPGGGLVCGAAAVGWASRVVEFAQRCSEEWGIQHRAVAEAVSAWPK